MTLRFSTGIKIFILVSCIVVTIIGFMLKLPRQFRGIDKEMHTIFYAVALLFINLLFSNKNILLHVIFIAILFGFGYGMEHAQEYSNKLIGRRIHGRFDIEDVKANTKGLFYGSIIWAIVVLGILLTKSATFKPKENKA